jgi:hypothetical protein
MSAYDISLWALVIAAISLGVSWLGYYRDKSNARLTVFKDAIVSGSRSNERLISFNVTNTGRRPVKISTVGYRRLWAFGRSCVITAQSPLPKMLDEGDDVVCVFKRNLLDNGSWKGVAYAFASDSAGKEYRRNIAPPYLAWAHRVLEVLVNPLLRVAKSFRREQDD